jgi:branched-chain amino acid transport system ATP-binding protein
VASLLRVEKLRRAFGALWAVNNLTFELRPGEILGIIGPNGAGKSTAINLISGMLRPHSGKVYFAGEDITGFRPHTLVQRGLVRTFQSTVVYAEQTVLENALRGSYLAIYPGFWHALFNTATARARAERARTQVDELLAWLNLTHVADVRAENLPYGFQKTLGVVVALATRPRLVMLDEPAAGLSLEEADHIREVIQRARKSEVSVIVVDHNMRFISGLCDRIVVMHHGSELALGTPEEVFANRTVIEAYLGSVPTRVEQ